MYEVISKLHFSRGVQIAIILFAVIVAPYWYCLHFRPHLVSTESTIKLLLSIIAIGGSVLGTNFALDDFFRLRNTEKIVDDTEKNKIGFLYLQIAALETCAILFFPCVWKYFDNALSFEGTIPLIGIWVVGSTVARVSYYRRQKRTLKEQLKKESTNEAQTP